MRARYLPPIMALGVLAACCWGQPEQATGARVRRHRGVLGRRCFSARRRACGAAALPNSSCDAPVGPERDSRQRSRSLVLTLEGRLRRLLQIEREVYEGIVRLDGLARGQRGRDLQIEAARLSTRQRRAAADLEDLVRLLREDGTSVGFPEALEQVRDDVEQVARRLAQGKVHGRITQEIQLDIIAALEEMVAIFDRFGGRGGSGSFGVAQIPSGLAAWRTSANP